MFLLYFTFTQRMSLIVFILVGFFYAVAWIRHNICFKHWEIKDLKAYDSKSRERYCSMCREEATNPKMKCSCGWKGRLTDLETDVTRTSYMVSERPYNGHVDPCFQEIVVYYCPDCHKPVIEYDN